MPGQEREKLAIVARLSEPIVRDDVGGDVESRLNRDLERVRDEAFLNDVFLDVLRSSEVLQLGDESFDPCQLLAHELEPGHVAAFGYR